MKYDLTTPCNNCPFRNDIRPYIRPERVEELRGVPFSCHKTSTQQGKENHEEGVQHCAGSLILHEKENMPHQMMRITERIGMYNRTKLNMEAPVYDSFDEMVERHWEEWD